MGLLAFCWAGSPAMVSTRKWTAPSANTKLAPRGCKLDQANRVPPVSPAQQLAPPAYLVLIGQLGRPITDATPTFGGVVSRPGHKAAIWFVTSRSPIMIVLLVPSA